MANLLNKRQLCKCDCGEYAKPGNTYIRGHNSTGRTLSEATKMKIGAKNAITSTGHIPSEEARRKVSIALTGHITTKETRRKIGLSSKGHITTKETRRKIGLGNKGKIITNDVRRRISNTMTGVLKSEEHCNNMRKARIKLCNDPEYRKRLLVALAKGRENSHILPNKQEQFILDLLNKMYPGEWKYTGDFSVLINGRNPDFINCNGQKKIIEFNGTHWHKDDIPGEREKIFAAYGYDTLIVWDRELKDIERVKSKINEFHRGINPYAIHETKSHEVNGGV